MGDHVLAWDGFGNSSAGGPHSVSLSRMQPANSEHLRSDEYLVSSDKQCKFHSLKKPEIAST